MVGLTLTQAIKKAVLVFILLALLLSSTPVSAVTQGSGSVGIEGTVHGKPPTQAPTITSPRTGQAFSSLPITVVGLCQSGLLVEVFKNNVFAGARQCTAGSYSIKIDLFSGKNVLVARDYDALNQASPDSNKVTVTFDNSLPTTGSLVSLTTEFAKRGAQPGDIFTWPITLSGGTGPYAISVDWGDKSTPDLLSEAVTGNIDLQHIYQAAGIYNITIRATDAKGSTAFLQLVGIGNGPIQQTTSVGSTPVKVERVVPWWALALLFALSFIAFWLGQRHQLQTIRVRLRKGLPPFG